jgi:hypothetical protein
MASYIYNVKALGINVTSKVPSFVERNLPGFGSSTVAESGIFQVTQGRVLPGANLRNAAEELYARELGNSRLGGTESFRDVLKKYSALPFGLPSLVITGKGSLGASLEALGMKQTGEKKDVYVGHPSLEQFSGIYKLIPEKSHFEPVPAGNVNIKGYYAAIWLWRGVGAFFDMGGKGSTTEYQLGKEIIEMLGKKVLTEKEKSEGWKYGAKDDETKKIKATPYAILELEDSRLVARHYRNYGNGLEYTFSGSTAPIEDQGFVFPYFSQMLNGDPSYACESFMSMFGKSVSENTDATVAILTNIRSGSRMLMNTDNGKVLQHIYQMISYSRKGGEKGIIISNGGCYAGFYISGSNTAFIARGRAAPIGTKEECIALAKDLNQHEEAIIDIGKILSEIPVNGMSLDFDVEMGARSPRYVYLEIRRRPIDAIEGNEGVVKKKLVVLIKKLRYNQEFWVISPENIVRFITLMSSGSTINDAPMLCDESIMLSRSTILEYLSVFGLNAPSIWNGEKQFKIPPPGTEDLNLVEKEGRQRLPLIPFITKGLNQAASDWGSVRASGGFKYFAAKKGGAGLFDDVKKRSGILDKKSLAECYPLLKAWIHADSGMVDLDKKKRQGEDISMEVKKAKLDVSDLL